MQQPQVKIDSIQVNIHIPQQLHIVRPHSAQKKHKSSQQIIEEQLKNMPSLIKQQQPNKQIQQQKMNGNSHKIQHIQTISDQAQFIDENKINHKSNQQQQQNKLKLNNQNVQYPIEQQNLQRIQEQNGNEQGNLKKLKHYQINKIQDKDQFNLRNSRTKIQQNQNDNKRKRYMSESNVQTYYQSDQHKQLLKQLRSIKKTIPQRIIEQQPVSPSKQRRKSVHSLHKYGSNQRIDDQIQRMIVDQVDKRKKSTKNIQKQQYDQQQQQMQQIKQQKQQEQIVNTNKLQQARQKMNNQIQNLSKVTGKQYGPGSTENIHLVIDKQQTIKQDPQEQKQQ